LYSYYFVAAKRVEIQKMKEKLDKFAYQHGFDALIPENWYLVKKSSIFKVCLVLPPSHVPLLSSVRSVLSFPYLYLFV
jgi:hypothetical protein